MIDLDDLLAVILISSDTSGLNWKGVVIWILFITIVVLLVSLL